MPTERSMAMFFDTCVQQGPSAAMGIAERVLKRFRDESRTRVPYKALLEAYAREAPKRYRRSTAPTKPFPSSHIEWRKTGSEWHAWAGQFDLYAVILRRRMRILADETLGDVRVHLPSA